MLKTLQIPDDLYVRAAEWADANGEPAEVFMLGSIEDAVAYFEEMAMIIECGPIQPREDRH